MKESTIKLAKLNAEESAHDIRNPIKNDIIATMGNTARGEELILTFPIQTVDSRVQEQYLISH
jgi:hypothetical protein